MVFEKVDPGESTGRTRPRRQIFSRGCKRGSESLFPTFEGTFDGGNYPGPATLLLLVCKTMRSGYYP